MRIDRWGANDTSLAAEQRLFEALRRKTPEQRLLMVFDRIETLRFLREATREFRKDERNDAGGILAEADETSCAP